MRILGLAAAGALVSAASASVSFVPSAIPFTDISTSGTSIGSISDDSETAIPGATLTAAGWGGNELFPGGVGIRIGNNGAMYWGNADADAFTNADQIGYINSTTFGTMAASNASNTGNGGSGPRQMLAVLWDDNTPGSGGNIKWQVIGSDLYVQWTAEDHFNASGVGTVTYQAVVRGGVTIASGNSLVDYVYGDTSYAANQYQNDGGSATIGYKNWGINASANDAEYGIGGGTDSLSDPAFGGTNMQPKVAGWNESADSALTHSVSLIPEPASLALIALGGLALIRRR